MLEGPLRFQLSHCLYRCMYRCMYVSTDVDFSSTSKGKPSLSNENTVTNFCKTWYVGCRGHKYYPYDLLLLHVHI